MGTRRVLGEGVTKNLEIDPDAVADLADAVATMPINKIAVLRADARAAIAARDAIDDWFSPEWAAAHKEAILACAEANVELERLAKNPKTRYGNWRTPFDIELMLLGYL
jgi:hypothetical protein